MLSNNAIQTRYQKEMQEFVYEFLDAFLRETADMRNRKFTVEQRESIETYLNSIIALSLICEPQIRPVSRGQPTYLQIRKLLAKWLKWNRVMVSVPFGQWRRERIFGEIQDICHRISNSYDPRIGERLEGSNLDDDKLFDKIDDAVDGLPSRGLSHINRFMERHSNVNRVALAFDREPETIPNDIEPGAASAYENSVNRIEEKGGSSRESISAIAYAAFVIFSCCLIAAFLFAFVGKLLNRAELVAPPQSIVNLVESVWTWLTGLSGVTIAFIFGRSRIRPSTALIQIAIGTIILSVAIVFFAWAVHTFIPGRPT